MSYWTELSKAIDAALAEFDQAEQAQCLLDAQSELLWLDEQASRIRDLVRVRLGHVPPHDDLADLVEQALKAAPQVVR